MSGVPEQCFLDVFGHPGRFLERFSGVILALPGRFLEGVLERFAGRLGMQIRIFCYFLGNSCAPCVSPVAPHLAIGTPALPRYAPRSVTISNSIV